MVERNAGLPPEKRIEFRIDIHLGDVCPANVRFRDFPAIWRTLPASLARGSTADRRPNHPC
jgi:hypothetical protein